jgi:spore maturation protein CgeB
MRDIQILDCPEIGCPQVLLYVFIELCNAFHRNGHQILITRNISEISNNSIVLMGDTFRVKNSADLLYKIAPHAIYLGWYWHMQDTSSLKNFIHIHEDFKNNLDNRMEFYKSMKNSCPLLLRANEKPELVATYQKDIKMDYCYMGWRYRPDMVPEKFQGLYHGVFDHNKFLPYDERKKMYLSSIFTLGFQSDENIANEHVSQRIFEGLAYGCVVISNSIPACNQTDNIVEYANSREELENKMSFYLENPELIKKKQEQGYEFIKKYGTNHHAMNRIIEAIKENTDIVI